MTSEKMTPEKMIPESKLTDKDWIKTDIFPEMVEIAERNFCFGCKYLEYVKDDVYCHDMRCGKENKGLRMEGWDLFCDDFREEKAY